MDTIRSARRAVRRRFLRSRHSPLFLAGCCMLLVWVGVVAGMWRAGMQEWDDLLTVGFAHLLAGRAISIAQGAQVGLPKWTITVVATYADVMGMLIVFPLFVFSYENLVGGRFFEKRMRPMLQSAQKNVTRFENCKVIGVFFFVWLPFWMTGIIVGAVLGYLLGLRAWVTVVAASLGALTAVASWVYAYDVFFRWLGQIHQEISGIFTAFLIVILLAARAFHKRRVNGQKARKSVRDSEDVV